MADLARRLGRVLRTLRYLKPRQALAQLGYMIRGLRRPRAWQGGVPTLAIRGVRTAYPSAPRHARLEAGRTLSLLNQTLDVQGGIDWSHRGGGPLFAYHLHQHDYLQPGALQAPDEARARAEIMLDWVRRHDRGAGWDPHPISLRAFTWARLFTTAGALDVDAAGAVELLRSFAEQIDALDRNIEVRLQANHLLSNLMAVVLGGLLLDCDEAEGWRDRTGWLEAELARQVHADGAHEERSPMYHALLLENVLDLLNVLSGSRAAIRSSLLDVLEETASRMLGALDVWTHRDGEIALFADSAFGVAQTPAELHRYARALGLESHPFVRAGVLEDGGYVRLDAGAWTCITSVAGPSPPHQPGHAHCDALACEIALGTERLVTDTGVYEYVPGERRQLARATRSHATLEIAGVDQAEIWAAHRIGGRPKVSLREVDPGVRFEASCAGWATRGLVHVRRCEASALGLTITDRVESTAGGAAVRACWPIAPEVGVDLDAATGRVVLDLPSGVRVRVELPVELEWRVERGLYFPEFGCEQRRGVLVGEGTVDGELTTVFRAE